jgi:hypothetical protein
MGIRVTKTTAVEFELDDALTGDRAEHAARTAWQRARLALEIAIERGYDVGASTGVKPQSVKIVEVTAKA